MTPAQRAIIAKAKKDGLKPSEQASEFLLHDVVEACLSQLRNYSVAWKNLSEKEQDASIKSLSDSLKESVTDAVRLIMSAGASAIPFKLKSLTIDGKLKVTGLVEGDHPERHALTDKAHDKSEILLILSPRDYFEGLDAIHGEKDQKSLPLDDEKSVSTNLPKKPKTSTGTKAKSAADVAAAIAFKPEQLDKAIAFVTEHRTPTTAGIQNILSVGYEKAAAILAELARQGVVVAQDDGKYAMPSLGGAAETTAEPGGEGTSKLTDELYEKMKAKTIKDQMVSAGGMAVAFDTSIPVADDAIERMELEGVISEEDEMGQRTVFDQE